MAKVFVATRKGLFTVEGGKLTASEFLGDNVSIVLPDPRDGTVYAAFDHGHFGVKMKRKKKGGAWEDVPAPAFPPKPEGAEGEWTVKKVWSLEPGGADRPGVLWAGTLPGGLFRSDDSGSSWTLVTSLWEKRKGWGGGGYDWPGIHSICVDPRSSDTVLVAVSTAGVWRTDDGGKSWTQTANGMRAEYMPPELTHDPVSQDVHRMSRCDAAPDELWAQHHNGVFRSVDAGKTWTELTNLPVSAFGFAAAAHPREKGTVWLVPAVKDEKRYPKDGAVVVNRTRDGGKTWSTLRAGLPQKDAYDLVYRHGLDVDATGSALAFGSTTGGFWTSLDGGDSWDALDARLPPVHCVRFER